MILAEHIHAQNVWLFVVFMIVLIVGAVWKFYKGEKNEEILASGRIS